MNCSNCGAPTDSGNDSVWTCPYCSSINYNELYAKQYAKGINLDKAESNYKIGLANFEGNRFSKAIDCFEKAIRANEKNGEAWIYLALSIAKETGPSSIEKDIDQVNLCISNGKKYCRKKEILNAGDQITSESFCQQIALMIAEKALEAKKAYNAFSSTNRQLAINKMNLQYEKAFANYDLLGKINNQSPFHSSYIVILLNEIVSLYSGSQDISMLKENLFNTNQQLCNDHPAAYEMAKSTLKNNNLISLQERNRVSPEGNSTSKTSIKFLLLFFGIIILLIILGSR